MFGAPGVNRAVEVGLNDLLLNLAQESRPSTGVAQAFDVMGAATKIADESGGKDGSLDFPRIWWGMTKAYYRPSPQETQARAALPQVIKPVTFNVPPPANLPERLMDVGVGLAAFMAKLAVAKKILPATLSPRAQTAAAFELAGAPAVPGSNAVLGLFLMGTTPDGAASLAKKFGMTAAQSAGFVAMAKAQGADLTDQLVQGLLPWVFAAQGAGRSLKKRLAGVRQVAREAGVPEFATKLEKAVAEVPLQQPLKPAEGVKPIDLVNRPKDLVKSVAPEGQLPAEARPVPEKGTVVPAEGTAEVPKAKTPATWLTSIADAQVDAELGRLGLPPATHGEHLSRKQALADAAAKMEADPNAGRQLVDNASCYHHGVTWSRDYRRMFYIQY
jgi:hypothetical protein